MYLRSLTTTLARTLIFRLKYILLITFNIGHELDQNYSQRVNKM